MIQGNVEVASRDGTGIKVNNEWYNVPPGVQPPRRGDIVTFEPQPDPSGRGVLAAGLQSQPGQQQGGYGGGGNRGYGGGGRRPGGGGGGKPKSPREVHGPIVGHSFLVAATMLGPGTGLGDIVNAARQIMAEEEKLLQEVIAGQGRVQQPQQPAQQPQGQPQQNFGYQQPQPQQQPVQQPQYQQPAQQPVDQGFDDGGDGIPW